VSDKLYNQAPNGLTQIAAQLQPLLLLRTNDNAQATVHKMPAKVLQSLSRVYPSEGPNLNWRLQIARRLRRTRK
jgi:hypothetical protein